MHECVRNSVFVSSDGGIIDIISSDGECVMRLPVPAGVQSVNSFLELVPHGGHIEVSEGLVCVPPRGPALRALSYGKGQFESGANPDFEPTSASAMERKMALLVNDLAAKSVERYVSAASAARAQLEVIPSAPPADTGTGEVVE